MARQPAFYIPHGGGPCFFMDWTPPGTWDALAAWLRRLPETLPEPPAALLVISAHWEEPVFTLATTPDPGLLFDYYGFPPHTYQLRWPAPPAPGLFPRVRALLDGAGIFLDEDPERDFDHGVFVPLLLSYPQATIPTLQLSMRHDLDPAAHLALGRALAPLRDEGVLVVGSGMSYHNMRAFRRADNLPLPDSDVFDTWLTATVTDADPARRNHALARWQAAPAARDSHPRADHLLPLMVVAGAAGDDIGQRVFACRAMGATIAAYRFG
ncbi:dioxygenase [Nitratidesulfovibrio sp. HK-II]|uniref:DODA-type extradiol aromatic ring-opening family dioxygenase n=1 Tax=Nitratidesulfovibrio sp. HK-II TaxID=2009266 RepID=UPI000E2FF033|nr:class III extradiol ring-cleavage dioxygenase [Nitratidesulfovibrio sp. HK-II]GBO97820.1 hypothetical protein RVX_2859 [Nitratidesulfovibrio sp. HK-II]